MDDFNGVYVQQLSFLAHGLVPYKDFAVSYPPLFLYVLYPFYAAGGANLASVPIIVSDAASAVVLFLIVERIGGRTAALIAGLAYALSPFAIFYEGYVWFSGQPMTFFAVLAVLFLLQDKSVLSFSSLAVAILFKQEAVFLLPVFLAVFALRDVRSMLAGASALLLVLLAASLPFLAVSSKGYLSLVTYGLVGGRWTGAVLPDPVTSSQICANVSSNLSITKESCTFGSTVFSEYVINPGPWESFTDALSYDLNVLSGLVVIPLFFLSAPVLYTLRKNAKFIPLVCIYAGIGFMILFAVIFHPVFKYYYLPIYAMLPLVVLGRGTMVAAAIIPILSLVTPSGAFQELFSVLAVLTTMALLAGNPETPLASNRSATRRLSSGAEPPPRT